MKRKEYQTIRLARRKRYYRTEEVVQVDIEVPHFARGNDEGEDLPVGVGSIPQVPGVTGDVEAAKDLVSDGLNAATCVRI